MTPRFVSLDVSRMLQGQADIVETIEQARSLKIADLKFGDESLRIRNGLIFEINRQLKWMRNFGLVNQVPNLCFGQYHRQQAILSRVVGENVGE